MTSLSFDRFQVIVELKAIKNTHLSVYPPEGRIRVAAPLGTSIEQVRLLLIKRRPWIEKQQRAFAQQKRETPREFVYRETHYYKGQPYLLRIHPGSKANKVEAKTKKYIEIYLKGVEHPKSVETVLNAWLRKQLRMEASRIIEDSELQIERPKLVIRDMQRKWGSYSKTSHTITLNLQLMKKPVECIEYVIIHELMHYREDKHNASFVALLAGKLPDWEQRRELLNSFPLAC